jgi:hypothetical protein
MGLFMLCAPGCFAFLACPNPLLTNKKSITEITMIGRCCAHHGYSFTDNIDKVLIDLLSSIYTIVVAAQRFASRPAFFAGSGTPKKMASQNFLQEKPPRCASEAYDPDNSILRIGRHASRTKQWRRAMS